ncbi:MAG: hypothetical protein D6775_00915 [Caldilineae bacterium]|nr:MAG: hypothetical protein D6775_00915 [Caldilineae bacterium]
MPSRPSIVIPSDPLRQRLRRHGPALLFLLALALYLALTLYQIELPGPNYDEAVEAKPAIQWLRGLPVEAHRDAVVHLLGRPLPLMVVDYVGALNTYVLLLFFKLGGIGVASMRLWPILVGAVILWLTYRLAAEWLGMGAALLAAFLLAVQPSFVFFSRQGIYVTNTTIAFSLAILLLLLRLVHRGRMRAWYGSWFLAGLGLWAKFIMLWPLAATAILSPVVWWRRRLFGLDVADDFHPRRLLHPRALLAALAAFLVGLSPFLLFNLKTGATFSHFLGTLDRSYYGVQNTDYLHNLQIRWQQIGDFLKGNHFWYLGGNFVDRLAWPAWLFSFVLLNLMPAVSRGEKSTQIAARRGLLFYVFFLLLLLQTPLTPTALWYTHLALFSPVLALATAAGWALLCDRLPRRLGLSLMIALGLALVSGGLQTDLQYHRALAASGGYADHSDAIYRLGETLLDEGIYSPYALDWGFEAPLILVTRGEVNPIEIFGYERFDAPDPGFADRLRPLLQDPGSIFLLHAPDRTNFGGRREALQALAEDLGVRLQTVAVVYERSGAPHTEILRPAAPQ